MTEFKRQPVLIIQLNGAIDDQQDQVCGRRFVAGTAHPLLFNRIVCITHSGRIDQPHREAGQDQLFFEGVASRAGHLGNDCPGFTENGIHQRAFADIRTAKDQDVDAVAQHPAEVETSGQRTHLVSNPVKRVEQDGKIEFTDLVIGKINMSLQ